MATNTKKKTTMTLKDFHGGSIPSDLPLPSAPGLSIRPPDRPAARPRPPGAAVRAPPFLPNPSHIGRNFDEDERKPFDSSTNPRRVPEPDLVRPGNFTSASVAKTVNYAAPAGPGGFPNAWSVSASKTVKEDSAPVREWSATRIAQTSAVEKVLSGMWQSKTSNVESFEMERPRSGSDVGKDRGVVGSGSNSGGVRPVSAEGRFIASTVVEQERGSEVQERPKLKLFPRTKQMESSDGYGQVYEEKQVYHRSVSAIEVNAVKEMHGSGNGSQVMEDEWSRAVERPKLNLKPRTQPVEQQDTVSVKERKVVFGGARPRELVLKERGIEVPNEPDLIVQPNRNDNPKTDSKSEPPMTNQHGERVNFSVGQKAGREDKRGQRPDVDKMDATRASWRNDTRKNTREIEKPPEQQRADIVDNWRKPVEPPKPEPSGLRFGKAASPLELAQAFSRSGSELNSDRNLPGRSQVPFTRLTDKREFYPRSAQKQINGY